MKAICKAILTATLTLSSLSLCSCGLVPPSIASNCQSSHQVVQHSSPSRFQQAHSAYNGYNMFRNISNPVRGVQQAAGNGLAGLLPWYSIGSDPNYQRQAAGAARAVTGGHHGYHMTADGDVIEDY